MTRCALYFGSFNPMHIGHLAITNYLTACTQVEEVMLVLSPQNPWKAGSTEDSLGAQNGGRSAQENLAHVRDILVRTGLPATVSDVEFHLPRPTYTLHSLQRLQQLYPHKEFILVIGADNLLAFTRWYGYREILRHYALWVYPRPGYALPERPLDLFPDHEVKELRVLDAPLVDLSSTFIRQGLAQGKNMNGFLAGGGM